MVAACMPLRQQLATQAQGPRNARLAAAAPRHQRRWSRNPRSMPQHGSVLLATAFRGVVGNGAQRFEGWGPMARGR
eukprot:3136059-Alexandrium_andersonii.AAC.1